MKYIITESRIELMLKEYITKSFGAFDVEFTTNNIRLGMGPNEKGETIVKRKVIEVYFNNHKDKKPDGELKGIKSKIRKSVQGFFNIEVGRYGGEWDLKVYTLERREI